MNQDELLKRLADLESEAIRTQTALASLRRRRRNLLIVVVAILAPLAVYAANLNKPYTFAAGSEVKAEEFNANFDALFNKVNSVDGKQWQLIYEITTTAPATSITIPGLNGDADVEYQLHMELLSAVVSTSFYIRPNSDSTAANYARQDVNGTNATAGAGRVTTEVGLTLGSADNARYLVLSGYMNAKAGRPRFFRTLSAHHIIGNTITTMTAALSLWVNNSSNIAWLDIVGSNANSIDAGTHIELWARR